MTYQVANWVFGIQGDYDWVGANGDANNTNAALGFGFLGVTNHVDIRSLAFLDWLTGFVEYDYYGFGTQTNAFTCTALVGCSVVIPTRFGIDVKQNVNLVKVGVT